MFRFTHPLRICVLAPVQVALRRAVSQRGASTLLANGGVAPISTTAPKMGPAFLDRAFQRAIFYLTQGRGRKARAPLEKAGECDGLVIGNTRAGVRSNALTAYERSDFIGQLYPLVRPRADAGDILALIDTAAAHAAYTHISGYVCGGCFVLGHGYISMATIAFNAFTFSKPVFQGDLIQVNTRIIHAGASSIGVYVHVTRQAFDAPTPQTVGESYVTMVIVNVRTLKVARGYIPATRLTGPNDKKHHREYVELRDGAKRRTSVIPERVLTKEEVEHPENKKKKRWLKLEDCVCRMDRSFGVSDINVNKAIFGGELLRFMEQCALHCGRLFAGQPRLFTLGMLDMAFEGALFIHDLARCKAQVTCVRRSTLLVNVRVIALDANGEERSTNRATFILVSVDSVGNLVEIENGIDLEHASQKELHKYWQGRQMMQASSQRRRKYTRTEAEKANTS